jgi:hypothetical protein
MRRRRRSPIDVFLHDHILILINPHAALKHGTAFSTLNLPLMLDILARIYKEEIPDVRIRQNLRIQGISLADNARSF